MNMFVICVSTAPIGPRTFFGRPVHELTLNEIEKFKTLDESVTVSETKDGFGVEIANVDLERHVHETGTPVTLAGVEFMHRP